MAKNTLAWVERFWEKVEKRGPDECWPWLAVCTIDGHGQFRRGPRVIRAHQVSFELAKGAIPSGMLVRHTCDHPDCVNPRHLILGTIADNNRDRLERGRYSIRPLTGRLARRRTFVGNRPGPVEARLLASVIKDQSTECWIWQKAKQRSGHALIKMPGGKMAKAHRVAYEVWVGPIPQGLLVLHSCDNGSCINPKHLRTGTHRDNMDDMVSRGRSCSGDRNFNKISPLKGSQIGLSKLTEEAVREIRSGMSTREAMQRFGVGKATVCKARTGFGWKHVAESAQVLPPPGKTKLTIEQVREIKGSAESVDALCQRFGISKPTVYRIKRLPSWNGNKL